MHQLMCALGRSTVFFFFFLFFFFLFLLCFESIPSGSSLDGDAATADAATETAAREILAFFEVIPAGGSSCLCFLYPFAMLVGTSGADCVRSWAEVHRSKSATKKPLVASDFGAARMVKPPVIFFKDFFKGEKQGSAMLRARAETLHIHTLCSHKHTYTHSQTHTRAHSQKIRMDT